jgi:hypothetical protein
MNEGPDPLLSLPDLCPREFRFHWGISFSFHIEGLIGLTRAQKENGMQ